MTVIRFFLIVLTVYFLYRFIFHLVIPVYKASRKIRQQFRDMQQHANDNINGNQQHRYSASSPQPGTPASQQAKAPTKEYIDFEEIKE